MPLSRVLRDQLVDLRQWSSASGEDRDISLFDFAGLIGTPDILFAYAELFAPELIEHEGGVFVASRFSEEAFELWKKKGVEIGEIQRVMNHVHVSTLMQGQAVSDELAVEAANQIARMWNLTLISRKIFAESVGTNFIDASVTLYRKE